MTNTTREPTVALVGAFDTKADEYQFVAARLATSGVSSILIDTGILGDGRLPADFSQREVAASGGGDLDQLRRHAHRNEAIVVMASGAANIVSGLVGSRSIHGLMVLGGSNAGYVMSQVATTLPIGWPKVLVSTITAGDTRPYVGTSDLTMLYPIVDIAGLNSVTRVILARAADACAGMVLGAADAPDENHGQRVLACSMFGVTTECVTAVHNRFAAAGDEVHVFHANGTGGRSLEAMTRSGFFGAVADITTTELADELLGGVCSAGPTRLTAAAEAGVPQVVSVGALDMVNFGTRASVPEKFSNRRLLAHNPAVTLMRTSADECAELGLILANKVNAAKGFTEVLVPSRGFSQVSSAGAPFHDPVADEALIESLRAGLEPRIPLRIYDVAINDPAFAEHISSALARAFNLTEGVTQ